MLQLILEENAIRDLPFLLRQIRPEREALSAACGLLARKKGVAEAVGILLEEQHRGFHRVWKKHSICSHV